MKKFTTNTTIGRRTTRIFAGIVLFILVSFTWNAKAQLTVSSVGTTYNIDFSTTVTGVNSGSWAGSTVSTTMSAGRLDRNGWYISTTASGGGVATFGGTGYTGGGASSGINNAGNFYAYNTGSGNPALGVSLSSSAYTPGIITLKIVNTTGQTLKSIDISYEAWSRNSGANSNGLDFYYSSTNAASSYTRISALDYTTATTATNTWSSSTKTSTITGLSIANNGAFYIQWEMATVSGTGTNDELAIDDITVTGYAAPTISSVPSTACIGSTMNITGTYLTDATAVSFHGTNAPTFTVNSSTSITVTVPAGTTTGTVSVTTAGGTATSSSITVGSPPSDNAGANKTICSGSSTTIGASSASGRTYSWSPSTGLSSSTSANPTANPTASTTYTLTETVTSAGCSASNSTVVTVNSVPGDNTGTDKSVCSGSNTTIGAASTSGRTYSWSPSTGLSSSTVANPTVTPTATTTYTLTETITATTCASTNSVVVTFNSLPSNKTVSAQASTICAGTSTSIQVSGATSGISYQLRNNSNDAAIGSPVVSPGGTILLPTGTLNSTTTFNVLATNTSTSCSLEMTNTPTVTVNPAPVDNTGSDKSYCTGGSTTLGASSTAGRTYSWSPSTGLNSSTKSNPTANPTVTTTYTLTETISATGCSASNTVMVSVSSYPSATISPSYCNGGGNVQLSVPAATSYIWSNGGTNQSITVDRAGTYAVTVTNAGICTATSSYNVALELVANGDFENGNTGFTTYYTYSTAAGGLYPEGTYTVATDPNYYQGNFHAIDHTTGSGKFMVINGATSAIPVTVWQENVTLIPNTTYYFSAYAMSMSSHSPFAQLKFAVNGVQVGTTANLTASVDNDLGPFNWTRFYATWNSGSSTSAVISIVDLQTNAGGNDFGLDDISCSTLSTVPLSATPTTNSPVCTGSHLVMSANVLGGMMPMTYTWSGPNSFTSTSLNDSILSAAAANAGVYSVTVTDYHGCTVSASTASATITALPVNKTCTAQTATICTGSSTNIQVALSQSGITYQLRNNADDSNIGSAVAGTGGTINLPTGTLTSTTTFNVLASTGTCTAEMTPTVTVTVNAKSGNPTSATAGSSTICTGGSTTLTLNGGGGGASETVKWYTVSCGGTLAATGNGATVSPTTTTTYYGRYEDASPCSYNSTCATVTVTVSTGPTDKTPTAVAATICTGGSTNIQIATSQSGLTYQLRNNATSANVGTAVSGNGATINLPTGALTSTTTFNVLATLTSIGCTVPMVNTVTVTVNAKSADPTSATAGSATICNGSSTTLTLNGGGGGASETVKWYTVSCGGTLAATGNGASVSPATTTTYYGRYEDAAPCSYNSACSSVTVTVVAKSTNPTSASASATTICSGSSTVLTLNGGGGGPSATVKWYTGSCGGTLVATGNGVSVSPSGNTTYYGRWEDGSPCNYNTTCSSVAITVNAAPANKTVTAASATICSGSSTNIQIASATLGATYQLRNDADDSNIGLPGVGIGGTLSLSTGTLTTTTTFNVLATTILNGCTTEMTNTPTVTVNVAPSFSPQPTNQTTCAGSSIIFSTTGVGTPSPTYQWYEKKGSGSFTAITNGTGSNGAVYTGATTTSLSISNVAAAMSGWTYYCTGSNSCANNNSNTVSLSISTTGQWVGTTSTDWNTATNWCGSVPTSTTDVTIPSGVPNQPTISTTAACRNLTINSGATVTITTGGDLSLYGNLTVNGTYTHTAGLLQLVGTSTQTVPAITVYNSTVNNSNGVTITGDLTVAGVLNLTNGKITTGSNEVKVTNTSTSAVNGFSANSYVIGNLRRSVAGTGSYDYPLGTSTKYEHLNITLASTTGFTSILGSFNNSNPLSGLTSLVGLIVSGSPLNGLLDYGYWTLTPNSTITGGSYSVTAKEQGHSNSAPSAGCYTLLKRHDLLSGWQALGVHNNATQSVTNGIVTAVRSGLTSFSDYSIGYSGTVLPIKLTYFKAEKYNDDADALLTWNTASEVNNDHFELEVATVTDANGQLEFNKIGEVAGSGTTTIATDYSFIDTEPNKSGIRYYRMKQVDFDGTFSYSEVQAVVFDAAKVEMSTLYPNPVYDVLHFSLQSPDNRQVTVSISNMVGQEVYKESISLNSGKNTVNFNVSDLPNGLYFLNMLDGLQRNNPTKFEKFAGH